MHSIKINRALRILRARWGDTYPRTERAVMELIPDAAKAALTSIQLADMADAVRRSYENGHAAALTER